MIRIFKGRMKTCQRTGFYAVVMLLVINTVTVAWLMRSGLAHHPGWPLWRISVVVSAVAAMMLRNDDQEEGQVIAGGMAFCWLLLPAVWLACALWNGQLTAPDPEWLSFTAIGSTILCWLMVCMSRQSQAK